MAEVQPWAYHGTDHFRQARATFIPPRIGGTDVVRLHLGCGEKKFRGYINIDGFGNPDVIADITDLPYGPETADEIMAIHVFEHFFPHDVSDILKKWREILKPNGKLILEMPDLQKVLEFFKKDEISLPHTLYALYGRVWRKDITELHKWAWTFKTIEPILKEAGYRDIVEKPAEYHYRERDFRVEALK